MRLSVKTIMAIAAIGAASPVLAQGPGVFAYESHANFCPTGLQPVSINGVVCCGTPNREQSYQKALRHPVASHVRSARAHQSCPAGVKGCS